MARVADDPRSTRPDGDRRPRARAAALPPEERRAAIVDAVLPLVLEHGSGVTTRQIAAAADIAEGTIFRVFADKDELIAAIVERVFDPAPVVEALRSIDRSLPLERRLVAAVHALQQRVAVIWRVMAATGLTKPPEHVAARRENPPDLAALAELIEDDADQFRCPPAEVALRLRAVTFACSHPAFVADDPMSAEAIVSLLLDGLRARTP